MLLKEGQQHAVNKFSQVLYEGIKERRKITNKNVLLSLNRRGNKFKTLETPETIANIFSVTTNGNIHGTFWHITVKHRFSNYN